MILRRFSEAERANGTSARIEELTGLPRGILRTGSGFEMIGSPIAASTTERAMDLVSVKFFSDFFLAFGFGMPP